MTQTDELSCLPADDDMSKYPKEWQYTNIERCNWKSEGKPHYCYRKKGHKGEHRTWFWMGKTLHEWELEYV